MTASLNLRRYRSGDDDRIRELHEEALRETGGFVEEASEPDLDEIKRVYLDQGGEFLVGEIDDRIIAMGAFRPAEGYITEFLTDLSDETAEIKRMRVDPAHQRQGHGQSIYDELEQRARERGFGDLVLDTTPQQVGARRFYEKNLFEDVQKERVQPGDEVFELIFYRKSLTDSTGD